MKIDIISGFLGAGKTTFIKRLLNTSLKNEKVILIENEFGEVSVDSDFLADSNIEIKELSQGCICCSLYGDFSKSLKEVIEKYNPDRVIIEPSGVGKLSDVSKAVVDAGLQDSINSLVCLVDVSKAKMYSKNFGEFFIDQIEKAQTVILSRTDIAKSDKIMEAIDVVRKYNEDCVLVVTPINVLSDDELVQAYEGVHEDLMEQLLYEHHHRPQHGHCCCEEEEHEHHHHHHEHEEECCCEEHEHHHHHHEHGEECCCGEHEHHHHHHEHGEECCCGEHEHHHHHHEHGEECCCGEHEHHHHHHEHGEECCCGEHDHHHHHHAEEVFESVGFETAKKFNLDYLKDILNKMAFGSFGIVIRAKGVVNCDDNKWYHFNVTPEEFSIEEGKASVIGKICIIGSYLDDNIKDLF